VSRYFFTSDSVFEGHADKVCDLVADTVLDAYLEKDPDTRAGCEVLFKGDFMVVAGEVTSTATVPIERLARQVIAEVGYLPGKGKYHAETVRIHTLVTEQSREIRSATDRAVDALKQRGASDQGIMFGMACSDTQELMPLPIMLAHRIGRAISTARKSGEIDWLRPDGKSAITVEYVDDVPVALTSVVVAVQHAVEVSHDDVAHWVTTQILPATLGEWLTDSTTVHVNPLGSFTLGGPEIDCGLTGRKLVVDTYGGMGRIGGGALSGKDPSKLDRTGTYFCRWVAKQLVAQGLARKVELQVAYGFGLSMPLSVRVDTFGTGDSAEAESWVEQFDFRPGAMAEVLQLTRPLYRTTTNYGHFGKAELPWEQLPDA
jgi:S-adenosylmethionine synthetase